MNNQFKHGIHRNKSRRTKRTGAWVRSLCTICAIVLCLTSFVGCSIHNSSEELDEWETELSDAIRKIKSLQDSNEATQQEIDALKSSYGAAQKELDSLKSSYEAAQNEIVSLKDSNEAAQQNINSVKSNYKAAQDEIDSLKDSYEVAQLEIHSLKSSNETAQQEIERLKEQIQELQENITADEPTTKIRIYIDQGHNPTSFHNAGATGNGLYEQDLTFTIGCLLAQLLEEDGRFEVCLSRPTANTVLGTDNTSSLEARVRGAQEFGADYFISLHINSYETESANGIEVLVAEQDSVSYTFGDSLLNGLIQATGLRNRGMKLNPDLYVLKNATMPAALLEMGFISNSEDAALLEKSPDLFAQGVYEGTLTYFNLPSNNSLD